MPKPEKDKRKVSSPSSKWQTEEGKKLKVEVDSFIKSNSLGKLDFSSFTLKPNHKIGFLADLSSINLSNSKFTTKKIINADFSGGDFSNCEFSDVSFIGVKLDYCNFSNSTFSNVQFLSDTTISSANFSNCLIEETELSDEIMNKPIRISVPVYWTTLWMLIKKMVKSDYTGTRYTRFSKVKIDKLNSSSNKELKEHINWYNHVTHQIDNYSFRSFKHKVSLIFAIVFTKYWTSYTALICWSLLINAIAATIIHLWPSFFYFKTNAGTIGSMFEWGWFSKFYYCIVTFTTLGYGDVTPERMPAQIVAGIVAVAGYAMLGTMIYLISRKADNKY